MPVLRLNLSLPIVIVLCQPHTHTHTYQKGIFIDGGENYTNKRRVSHPSTEETELGKIQKTKIHTN